MRRTLSCVLMMTLLLCACGGKEKGGAEQLAARIRAEYLSAAEVHAEAELSAVYGEEVFDFTVDVRWRREGETVLTVTEPEMLSGVTARIREKETLLEYDGAGLSLGMLDPGGLTPVSAMPAMMEQITTGYMARCTWQGEGEQRQLAVLCRDPDAPPQQGVEYMLYFDPDDHALLRGEVSVDGQLRLTAKLSGFTMELTKDETGRDENVG